MLSRLLFTSALLAAALSSVQAGYRACIDEVKNPSFEQCQISGKPGVLIPIDWTQDGSGSWDNPTVYCSSDEHHSGSKSAKFVPQSITNIETGQQTYYAEIWQNVGLVQSGQLITLTYWVKYGGVPQGVDPRTSGTYKFSAWYNDDHSNEVEVNPTYVAGSSQAPDYFYQYKATFFAPNNAGTIGYITIGFETTDTRIYIHLDDIELKAPCISGDPQFVGLRGQSYQVHGIDGEIYNLVSSTNTQVNSAFTFLNEGQCPIINSIPTSNCWSHPGSYLGAIGVQQRVGDKLYQLKIVSGDAATGFELIELNGVNMTVKGAFADTDMFVVTYVSSHQVTVQVEEFIFSFDNSDKFINQGVAARVALPKLTSHGLIGQTHKPKLYKTTLRYIEGEIDDYMIMNHDLFGTDFVYNRFVKN
jgi:hypothetical protein